MAAPSYELINEYVDKGTDLSKLVSITTSPHWALCVVRLGLPLSYSRSNKASVTNDVSQGGRLRGPNLVITSDCTHLTVSGSKDSHVKALNAELKQTDHNYLVEILPGDWILAWIVNDETKLQSLVERIRKSDPSDPCNKWDDGFKFLGRVDNIRKAIHLDRGSGTKTSSYTITAAGFKELDTSFFFDKALSDHSAAAQSMGDWLAKLSIKAEELFLVDPRKGQKPNTSKMILALLDLIVGKGVGANANAASGGEPALRQTTGGGTTSQGEAPFSYLVPRAVGALLGITNASKPGGLLSYADLLTTVIGVQKYSGNSGGSGESAKLFPDFDYSSSTDNRIDTGIELLGTFYPGVPDFANRPLWSLLQQYLNATINEMYTCLRVGPNGRVIPTLVVRQIPFTTEAYPDHSVEPGFVGPPAQTVNVTKFLSLPRWKLHDLMLNNIDIGRSDATRFNFIHVYGQEADTFPQNTFSQQITDNPPIRDDLDIQRSGLRAYMTTVACATQDTVGKAPTVWMELIADRVIGSQYTVNGTLQSVGITSPISEGDNIELDDTVYHIESCTHTCGIQADGQRTFDTTLTLTNGMRSDGINDRDDDGSQNGGAPIYPGFRPGDNRAYDPGLTIVDRFPNTPPSIHEGDLATSKALQPPSDEPDVISGLPTVQPDVISGAD